MKVVSAGVLGFLIIMGLFWCSGMEFERGPDLALGLMISLLTGFISCMGAALGELP